MSKARLVVIAGFCIAFAAGIAAGLALARTRGGRLERRSWLTGQLDLTTEQREQMRQIWSEVMGDRRAQRRALREERDKAIQDLLSDKQKTEYEEVMQEYARKSEAMNEARRTAFDQAVERTKAILTEEQRVKYEKVLDERAERRGRGGPGGGFRRHRPGGRDGDGPPRDDE